MSDITKCQNDKCKLRLKCYRFLVPNSECQWYGEFEPVKVAGEWECKYQVPNPDYCAKISSWKTQTDFEVK